MMQPQFILPLATKLIVDLFAGGGGASTGIEQALMRHVDIAINHDAEAISLHQANHPQTKHYVTNVWDVVPETVTGCQQVWASPDCRPGLADQVGVPATSGGYRNNLSRLKTMRAIDYPSPGTARASAILFPERA